MACPSWPFRTGKNPWREVSEGRREAGRRLAAQRAAKSSELKSDLVLGDETSAPALSDRGRPMTVNVDGVTEAAAPGPRRGRRAARRSAD
jgi:hypothetical protein